MARSQSLSIDHRATPPQSIRARQVCARARENLLLYKSTSWQPIRLLVALNCGSRFFFYIRKPTRVAYIFFISLTHTKMENTCTLSEPLDLDPQGGTDFEFSKITCSSTKELITNTTTGAEFYFDNTITIGDTILFWFLTIFSVGLIFSIIFKFFWRKF